MATPRSTINNVKGRFLQRVVNGEDPDAVEADLRRLLRPQAADNEEVDTMIRLVGEALSVDPEWIRALESRQNVTPLPAPESSRAAGKQPIRETSSAEPSAMYMLSQIMARLEKLEQPRGTPPTIDPTATRDQSNSAPAAAFNTSHVPKPPKIPDPEPYMGRRNDYQ
ncbi:hypothetical protein EJ02DRAFT_460331 [Clathrospora elynae]|uniref:Uncharacterized protein n=1 Tax=Clathrospora elynae TaxID=706981 RepID=A0A6A5S7J8_9PLEO|nr:hypothetical protein EJ02DRAFT_460331 [Clathrospora elynae]